MNQQQNYSFPREWIRMEVLNVKPDSTICPGHKMRAFCNYK